MSEERTGQQAYSEGLQAALRAKKELETTIEDLEYALRYPDAVEREEAQEKADDFRHQCSQLRREVKQLSDSNKTLREDLETMRHDRDHWMARAGDIFENFEQTRRATA